LEKIIVNNLSYKRLISKIYNKEFMQLNGKQTKLIKSKIIQLKMSKGLEEIIFFKEGMQMANKYMKRYSTSLFIRERQIKTTMKYHLVPVRMSITKEKRDNKCWHGSGEKGILVHCC